MNKIISLISVIILWSQQMPKTSERSKQTGTPICVLSKGRVHWSVSNQTSIMWTSVTMVYRAVNQLVHHRLHGRRRCVRMPSSLLPTSSASRNMRGTLQLMIRATTVATYLDGTNMVSTNGEWVVKFYNHSFRDEYYPPPCFSRSQSVSTFLPFYSISQW